MSDPPRDAPWLLVFVDGRTVSVPDCATSGEALRFFCHIPGDRDLVWVHPSGSILIQPDESYRLTSGAELGTRPMVISLAGEALMREIVAEGVILEVDERGTSPSPTEPDIERDRLGEWFKREMDR